MHGTFPLRHDGLVPQPAPAVLLLEKHSLARDALAFALEEAGISFAEADGGPEALALLLRRPFRVLVTNLSLGQDSRDQAGRRLADEARLANPGLAVVYTCGLPARLGRPLGPLDRLLRKPFTTGQMIQTLNELLALEARPERHLAVA